MGATQEKGSVLEVLGGEGRAGLYFVFAFFGCVIFVFVFLLLHPTQLGPLVLGPNAWDSNGVIVGVEKVLTPVCY